jgi:hypothetical protein
MASTSALLTINDVIDRFLLKYKKTTEDAVIYTEHACNCVRDFSLYHGNEITTAKVSIDANYIIEMPSDMIGFVDLCWYFAGKWWSFTEQRDIVNTTTFTGLVEGRDSAFQEGQPISHATTYGYGARGGVNAYNYSIDWQARRIFVEGVNSDTAVLMYTGTGITANGTTYVSDLLTPVIDNYLLYVETFWLKDLVREREMRKKAYNDEVLKARNFVNALTYNQIRDLIMGTTTQGIKR